MEKLTYCPKCNLSSMYCYCPKCGERKPQKQINYERIKNMSVEEMADIIRDIYTQGYIDCLQDEGNVSTKEIEQWLLQEVDNG